MLSVLHTIWQADGTFPSGSFAFSYGFEGLADLGMVHDRESLAGLVTTVLRERWATFDRVALVRAHRSAANTQTIAEIDADVEAATFGESMRSGSRRNGNSFLTTMIAVGNPVAVALRAAIRRGECLGHIAVMQGAVWSSLGVDEPHAQTTSAYIALSGIVSASVRLGLATAMQAQSIVYEAMPVIAEIVSRNIPDDAQLASFVPLLDIASARQENSDLRLFAN